MYLSFGIAFWYIFSYVLSQSLNPWLRLQRMVNIAQNCNEAGAEAAAGAGELQNWNLFAKKFRISQSFALNLCEEVAM